MNGAEHQRVAVPLVADREFRIASLEAEVAWLRERVDPLERVVTILEERVDLLARLHDEVAADVCWMDAVSRVPVERSEDGPAHEG